MDMIDALELLAKSSDFNINQIDWLQKLNNKQFLALTSRDSCKVRAVISDETLYANESYITNIK